MSKIYHCKLSITIDLSFYWNWNSYRNRIESDEEEIMESSFTQQMNEERISTKIGTSLLSVTIARALMTEVDTLMTSRYIRRSGRGTSPTRRRIEEEKSNEKKDQN